MDQRLKHFELLWYFRTCSRVRASKELHHPELLAGKCKDYYFSFGQLSLYNPHVLISHPIHFIIMVFYLYF
jgi:hypothetical protein